MTYQEFEGSNCFSTIWRELEGPEVDVLGDIKPAAFILRHWFTAEPVSAAWIGVIIILRGALQSPVKPISNRLSEDLPARADDRIVTPGLSYLPSLGCMRAREAFMSRSGLRRANSAASAHRSSWYFCAKRAVPSRCCSM